MKKLLLTFFFALAFFVAVPQVFAQTVNSNEIQEIQDGVSASETTPNRPEFIYNGSVRTTVNGIVCMLVVDDECFDPGSGRSSALQSGSKAIAMLYQPPATTGTYVADLLNSAGLAFAKPAYAQGLGFAALDPILETWKVLRNVAYLFYVILFLVIGFAIMFRQKLNSQTAITAQQALPKIIVSLIAVTFSYAIAGFLIDMMYVLMFLMISLFAGIVPGGIDQLRSVSLDKDIFSVGLELIIRGGALGSAYNAVETLVISATEGMVDQVQGVLGFIGGLTFMIVFALATVFAIFKLFFELLKTYISIIIAIVMSPLALMLGALPGNNAFSSWLKTLIANLMVFPAVMLILILFLLLLGNSSSGGPEYGGFLPPYLIGRGSGDAIRVMLGLGVILILPELVMQVKSSLGGKGGIFEQFANNFTSALEKGWKGGQLVPGLGASDTNNIPFIKQMGGLSGKNIVQKASIGASGVGGALLGGASGVIRQRRGMQKTWHESALRGGLALARRFSDQVDDKQALTTDRADRKAGKQDYNALK